MYHNPMMGQLNPGSVINGPNTLAELEQWYRETLSKYDQEILGTEHRDKLIASVDREYEAHKDRIENPAIQPGAGGGPFCNPPPNQPGMSYLQLEQRQANYLYFETVNLVRVIQETLNKAIVKMNTRYVSNPELEGYEKELCDLQRELTRMASADYTRSAGDKAALEWEGRFGDIINDLGAYGEKCLKDIAQSDDMVQRVNTVLKNLEEIHKLQSQQEGEVT